MTLDVHSQISFELQIRDRTPSKGVLHNPRLSMFHRHEPLSRLAVE